MAVRVETQQTQGVSVRLFRDGEGPPLLYLHGASGVPAWNDFFARLANRYAVHLPEHPGFGASDDAPFIRNIADLAMHYLDVLDAFPKAPVHVVGNSLGGWLAAEVAARNCSRIASLTLIAPAGLRVKGVPSGDNFIWAPDEAVRNMYHDQTFAERLLAQEPSQEEADQALRNRFMSAKLGWEPRWFNPALARWLHRIRVPALLVWGADDKFFPCAYAAAWQQGIPGLTVEIVPDCGHLPHIEKADVAAAKVLGFLDGVRR